MVEGKIVVSPLPPIKRRWWLFTSKRWRLERSFAVLMVSHRFTIPAGWEFDFASIPRPIKFLFPDDAIYSYGATLHDYLYKTGVLSKWMADALFFELLVKADHCPRLIAFSMWLGVALGGWPAWLGHRRNQAE